MSVMRWTGNCRCWTQPFDKTRAGRLVAVTAVVLASLAAAESAGAQEVGIRAGISSASISFDPGGSGRSLSESRRRTGVVAGASIFVTRGGRGGLQLEALLHQKGVRNLLRIEDAFRLTYLEIPLLLHLDVVNRGDRGLFVTAGPALAINLAASYEDDGESESIRDDIEKTDIGVAVGAGYEHGPWIVDARYTWGLRTVFEIESLGRFENRSLTVTGGFRFRRY